MRKIAIYVVLHYLRFWAKIALATHRPKVVGIAGSVGKSSTKEVLCTALAPFGKVLATQGNSETGLPLSILGVQVEGYGMRAWLRYLWQAPFGVFNLVGVDYLIAEMGIDSPLWPKNMEYLLTIVEPDIAVIVQESAAHTEQFEEALTQEERATLGPEQRLERLIELIVQEDLKMVLSGRCRTALFNADTTMLAQAMNEIRKKKPELKQLSFGMSQHNDAYYVNEALSLDETRFDLQVAGSRESLKLAGFILPIEYREVLAAALLTVASLGLDVHQAAAAIEQDLQLPKGRASSFKGIRNTVILDSSYNASRESVMAFLDLVERLKKQTGRSVVFAFGDMRELGDEATIEHETVARRIIEVADNLYCVGELTKKFVLPLVEGKIKEVKWFERSTKLGDYLNDVLPEQSLVLVKGSQNTIFLEEAVKKILADPSDVARLCRQEEYWMATKKRLGF